MTPLIFGFLFLITAEAHKGDKHKGPPPPPPTTEFQVLYAQANQLYQVTAKPIFQKKCFDCHTSTTQYPWYYKVPGIKQLLDHDINEAKKHLDGMEKFPFKSHATPLEDLEEIREVTVEETMPPFLYKLMHSKSHLTAEEKEIVLKWLEESITLIKK